MQKKLLKILKETFGYTSFRLNQEKIIHAILEGKDTLAILPTGGGKSICYQVPALYLEGITLVISPLISLMHDQVSNLAEHGVEAVFLNSSLSYQDSQRTKQKILRGEVKLVYVSPEGILSNHLSEFFNQVEVSLIAIDEAHCMSQWGHEFRKDYTRLGELRTRFKGVPVLALTATADERTRVDICQQLGFVNPDIFISSFDRPNITYMIHERSDEIKQLNKFIKDYHSEDTGIVYCLSRDKVERVAENLKKLGHPAVPYHAGLGQDEREENQKLFNTEDKIIVVATIAFGMGIDRPDVRFVAHLDLPKSIEGYYQETGRAGRDGKASSAWMIYGLQDVVKLSQMIESSEADEAYKKVARHKIDSMLALCESGNCRRKYLLSYFGEQGEEYCGNCDTCKDPPVLWDATIDAQKILSTIYRTQQVFGAGHVIDVIRGSKSAKITEKGHDQLSVFGIGKDRPKEHWNSVLRQLLNSQFITIKNWEYRSLGLTQKAQDIFSGKTRFELRKQDYQSVKEKKKSSSVVGNSELFDELKKLRNHLAKEKGLPPYLIFNDKTLQDMCAILPRNEEEFLLVHGVGQNKLERYGSQFLKALNSRPG